MMTTLRSPAARRGLPAAVSSSQMMTMRTTRMMSPSRRMGPRETKKVRKARTTKMTTMRTARMRTRIWMMASTRMSSRISRRRLQA